MRSLKLLIPAAKSPRVGFFVLFNAICCRNQASTPAPTSMLPPEEYDRRAEQSDRAADRTVSARLYGGVRGFYRAGAVCSSAKRLNCRSAALRHYQPIEHLWKNQMAEHDRHTGHHHNGGHGDTPDSVTEGMRGDVPSKDPVCGMTVDPATAAHRSGYHGRQHYFCSAGCRTSSRDQSPDRAAAGRWSGSSRHRRCCR